MANFRFIGQACEIGSLASLTRFGESVELAENVAVEVILGGGAILPAADFDSLGFTESELADFAFPGQQQSAPETFQEKRRQALARYNEIRDGLEKDGQ